MKVSKYRKKNGETAWRVDIHLGRDPLTGKKRNTTLQGFPTEKAALIAGARRLEENQPQKKKQSITFSHVCKEWLELYKLTVKESTFRQQVGHIERHILPYFGQMLIQKIEPKHCQEAIKRWHPVFKYYSLLISIASRIFEYARLQLNLISTNPFKNTIRPKRLLLVDEKKYEAPYYNRQQLQHFLKCVETLQDPQATIIFRVLAYTGMREGEVMGLKWSDFNELKGSLTVRRTVAYGINKQLILQPPKTSAGLREISLDKITINMLKEWRKTQRKLLIAQGHNVFAKEQFIITDQNNHFRRANYPYGLLNILRKKTNIDKITVHGLRHTHCTLLLESGVPVKEIQKRLGHERSNMVMEVYSHINKDRMTTLGTEFADFVEN